MTEIEDLSPLIKIIHIYVLEYHQFESTRKKKKKKKTLASNDDSILSTISNTNAFY